MQSVHKTYNTRRNYDSKSRVIWIQETIQPGRLSDVLWKELKFDYKSENKREAISSTTKKPYILYVVSILDLTLKQRHTPTDI